jgi:hypothetical protein
MTQPTDPSPLAVDAIETLARLAGYPPIGAATAERIATGAAHAIAAVRVYASESLFDVEPGAYLAELDRLAGDEP